MTSAPNARPLLAFAAACALAAGCAAASAQSYPEPARPAFYEAPANIPAPGSVIRSEPLTFAIDPAQIATSMVRSTRVLYASTDRRGRAVAVSGSVMVPLAPWFGSGPRPLIAYAPGTQGMGDRCAPSRMQTSAFEYESIGITGLLARGYAVAMTDYQGLGTAGAHTYGDRIALGRAVLDAARAALRLPEAGLSASTPIALVGYSQGGGAAAAAAELWKQHAPELRIRGASIGAPPADLAAVGRNIEGSLFTAFELYGAVGLAASYGADLSPLLSDKGRATLAATSQACVFDLFANAFLDTATLTASGEKLSAVLSREPNASILDAQRIGRVAPKMPVQINHSFTDDVIPFAVGRQMGRDWCARGANVVFMPMTGPLHVGGMIDHLALTHAFLEARFNGWPQWSTCGWF